MRPGFLFLTALVGASLAAVFTGPAFANGWGFGCGSCGYGAYPAGQVYYAAPTYSYAPPTVTVIPHYVVQPHYYVRRTYVIEQNHYVNESPACGSAFDLARLFNPGSYCGGAAVAAPAVRYESETPAYYAPRPRYVSPAWRHYQRRHHRVYVISAPRRYRYGTSYRAPHRSVRHKYYQTGYR